MWAEIGDLRPFWAEGWAVLLLDQRDSAGVLGCLYAARRILPERSWPAGHTPNTPWAPRCGS